MSVTLDVDDERIPGLDVDGRPDPVYAARLGLVPAPGDRRSAAFALDAGAWAVLAVPGAVGAAILASELAAAGFVASALAPGSATLPLVLVVVSQALLTVFGLVQLILHGRRGVTLGKASMGLRSVNVASFRRPGFWRVTLRALVLWGAQAVVPLVGPGVLFASSSWDPESRGRSWLDRIGGCYVVDARRGIDPFDSKAMRHARRALAAPPAAEPVKLPSLATDRAPDERTFIPSARSSSGVVSPAPEEAGAWVPPGLAPSASAPQAAPATAAGAFVLEFDDGTRVAASTTGLLGRNPSAAPDEPRAQLLALVDDSMRISKTHAAFGVDAAGFWMADRSSKNGTTVHPPDGEALRLAPGVRTAVPAGSRVTLGGRSFVVVAGRPA
ncbi:RDD family protein [Agromyces sp. Marseille-P2726]|uniref:RDD family protein n=1 Tax=Agromyces sp. Marseille-P2726 TaxID=2709132 RepID=UPI00156DEC2C|nr:RDD family protein [Agromyces sp. Marseille-P2726]